MRLIEKAPARAFSPPCARACRGCTPRECARSPLCTSGRARWHVCSLVRARPGFHDDDRTTATLPIPANADDQRTCALSLPHKTTPENATPAQRDPDDDDYYYSSAAGARRIDDPRFDPPPEEVPWASVALALFLLLFGAASLALAWLHWTQALFGKEQAEVGFTVMGLLTIIPGEPVADGKALSGLLPFV